jgi:hypothetical protein
LFYTAQNVLKLGPVPKILLPSVKIRIFYNQILIKKFSLKLRAIQLPSQESIVKIESYDSTNCATHMLIFFEHGITSIRDYVLIEILVETIQESLEDYLQSAGQNHFICNGMFETQKKINLFLYRNILVTLRDTYGIISLQIEL